MKTPAVLSVLGGDCVGIVANVSRVLAEVGDEMGLQITLQREDVFRFMHRI